MNHITFWLEYKEMLFSGNKRSKRKEKWNNA